VNDLSRCPTLGPFAAKVGSGELFAGPRKGMKDDKAHPPIHPVKFAPRESMTDQEWKIYDLLSRHFLATMAKDALGSETKIVAEHGLETFNLDGEICE
jgi:DNA topoisomerase-3